MTKSYIKKVSFKLFLEGVCHNFQDCGLAAPC